ncbi:hypothetical protein H6F43_12355 [Leptolyngbya sp. FACHB-36]|uniref:hypothetical protein n=1 Tax=Leptolyngbya sp. FACHB-36 TaxID=2692808 RepID=UPI001680CCB4|nr:hypothetical protein [Leptolyngbya sp. FACHB-36]MBD2020971.1 hypothetical protein [Leptolyngbya sp. FACHB-36]
MDMLQEQVNILSEKVEALSQRIEQLSSKLSDVAVECKFGSDQIQRSEGETSGYRARGLDASMGHKDILVDGDSLDAATQQSERQLSPAIQIQRLTAQLTAAYNRIAALEEQLLSKRIH